MEETSKLGENVHPPRSWKLISWRWGARWKARNSIFTKWQPKARSRLGSTNKSNRGKWNPTALFLNFTSNNFEETYIGENDSPRRKSERKITKAAGLGLGLKFPPVGKEKLSEGCKCVKVKLGYAGLHIYIYLQNDSKKILFAGKIVSGLKFPSVGRMISCLLLQWMQMAES